MKSAIIIALMFLTLMFGCKQKEKEITPDVEVPDVPEDVRVFPKANERSYWEIRYATPMTHEAYIRSRIDSVFVSTDTVMLTIVDTMGRTPDTTRKAYMVLKCYSREIKYYEEEWRYSGLRNYGVARIDDERHIVYTVRPTVPYVQGNNTFPSTYHFYEVEMFDYSLKEGDRVTIRDFNNSYEADVTKVEETPFGKYTWKKQTFRANGDTFVKVQFGGITDLMKFSSFAIPDRLSSPNSIVQSINYHDETGYTFYLYEK